VVLHPTTTFLTETYTTILETTKSFPTQISSPTVVYIAMTPPQTTTLPIPIFTEEIDYSPLHAAIPIYFLTVLIGVFYGYMSYKSYYSDVSRRVRIFCVVLDICGLAVSFDLFTIASAKMEDVNSPASNIWGCHCNVATDATALVGSVGRLVGRLELKSKVEITAGTMSLTVLVVGLLACVAGIMNSIGSLRAMATRVYR
jgi:hypothetical protein